MTEFRKGLKLNYKFNMMMDKECQDALDSTAETYKISPSALIRILIMREYREKKMGL
jgi:hypothetical protein